MHEKLDSGESVGFWGVLLLIGLWGGIVRYLNETFQNRRKFTCVGLLISGVVSSFYGLLLGFLTVHLGLDIYMSFMASGIGGSLGDKTISLIIWYVSSKRLYIADKEN